MPQPDPGLFAGPVDNCVIAIIGQRKPGGFLYQFIIPGIGGSNNELVQEAARLSLANNGDYAVIDWSGEEPRVRLRHEKF